MVMAAVMVVNTPKDGYHRVHSEYDGREMSAFAQKISRGNHFAFHAFSWTCGCVRTYGRVWRDGFRSYPRAVVDYHLSFHPRAISRQSASHIEMINTSPIRSTAVK